MSEKILVVDDEREIADLVALYLENEGFAVVTCYNGADALAYMEKEPPDLAVLDIMLPDLSGFVLCRKIREKYRYPVIMLTAKGEELDKVTGLTLGADDYVTYAEISVQISEIRSAMQRHEQMQKEASARKNDLIAYLAHDLRTPLTSVVGYLSLLDEAADMPEEQRRKYIRIAFQKARRLEELNNEFFEITRYNLQRMDLEKKPIDLYYMLCQMAEEFYPLLQEHGSRIILRVGEDLVIRGDGDKLARAFGNILKNAIAYSYPDTDIEIRSEPVEGGLCLHFSNKGPTIPPQKLEAIFDKFVRLDASRSSHTGGAGLGLAIAREIITLHGGEITANSEDEMTVFYVILPVD